MPRLVPSGDEPTIPAKVYVSNRVDHGFELWTSTSPHDKDPMKFVQQPGSNGHGRTGKSSHATHSRLYREIDIFEYDRTPVDRFARHFPRGARRRVDRTTIFGREDFGNRVFMGFIDRLKDPFEFGC